MSGYCFGCGIPVGPHDVFCADCDDAGGTPVGCARKVLADRIEDLLNAIETLEDLEDTTKETTGCRALADEALKVSNRLRELQG